MTAIDGTVAFVSGGQRGIGRAIARELLDGGAAKVYVSARRPGPESDPRLVPVALDVTDPVAVRAAAELAADTRILVDNAGIAGVRPFLSSDPAFTREVFETNFFGALDVAVAFAPVIEANGGGTIAITLSVLSWLGSGPYGASKAALWNAATSLRGELRPRGVRVLGVHVARVATEMTAAVDGPKTSPQDMARVVVEGIRLDRAEVLVDDTTRAAKAALSGPVEGLELP